MARWRPAPHKNDRRDAEHLLDLLITGRFPAIEPRSDESRKILGFLTYRHSLVKARTATANQLQAMARSFGLNRFGIKAKYAESRMTAQTGDGELLELVESRFWVHRMLSDEIEQIEKRLNHTAHLDERAKLLMTHPGIGELTSLCAVHTPL